MLRAVKALGEYVCKTTNIKEESRFVESSKIKDIKKVLCINFNFTNGTAVYTGLFSEAFDQNQATKYLYRVFSHRRFEVTPTSKMSNPEKLKKRFALWFKQCCSKYLQDYEGPDSSLLQALKNEFMDKINQIFSDIDERFKTLSKDEIRNTIVTITINSEKHLGDLAVFREILKKEACSGYYAKHNVESKGKGTCYLCGEDKEVLGFASPFPVYTVDQKGFAPNFLQWDAWKRLPLCLNCAILSSIGKEFVENHLLKGFYGIKFYVIPSFALKFDESVLECIKNPRKSYWKIVGNEDDISEIMADRFDQATLTFVFIKPEKATFRIVRYVEDVPPSYLREIKKSMEELIGSDEQRWSIFKENLLKIIFGDKNFVGDLTVFDTSLGGLIWPFFPHSKYEGIYDKYFIDLVSDILAQKEIRSRFLIEGFARALRASFVKGYERKTKELALKSLMLVLLTRKLNLLKDWSEEQFMPSEETNEFSDFFNQYKNAFSSASKQAVFLEGVLAKFLMDVQYANRQSSPFSDKLYGLRIDERRAKKLFPEIIEKLREYKMAYTSLEAAASKALLEAENKGWNLAADEVSYFFTLGMILAPIFKKKAGE